MYGVEMESREGGTLRMKKSVAARSGSSSHFGLHKHDCAKMAHGRMKLRYGKAKHLRSNADLLYVRPNVEAYCKAGPNATQIGGTCLCRHTI